MKGWSILLTALGYLGSPAVEAQQSGKTIERAIDMQENQNRIVIHRYFEEVWNQGKLDVLDDLIAPDYLNHSASTANPKPGPADLKPIVAHMREAIPDLHYEILDLIIAGDKVAVYTRVTGTQASTLWGIAPSGKRIDVRQMQIEWLRNGQIVQHWRITDELGLLRQLGVIPSN